MGVPALLITPRAPPFPPPRGGNERYPPEIRRCDNMRDREKSRLDPTFLVSLSRQIDLWWSQGPSTGRKRLARKHLQRLGLPAPGSKRTVSMAVAFAMKRKKELMRAWDDDGAMIVVLEVADAKGLAQLRAAAKKHGLATQVVEDEGRTEARGLQPNLGHRAARLRPRRRGHWQPCPLRRAAGQQRATGGRGGGRAEPLAGRAGRGLTMRTTLEAPRGTPWLYHPVHASAPSGHQGRRARAARL
ncbi:unnamed protein product [Prorocentrum cordatum]|uniref:peptidyl-tRNA hydrolase n=1 Tax=Prorocentrum cordatum TaxID=2364126 RepID=A0ABN9WR20_9DINO|nr:unnamed protein product [Polarella glacialis]